MDTVFDISTFTIVEHFGTLEDPHIERTKLHLLLDSIALTICAVICGADGPVDSEQYGKKSMRGSRPHGLTDNRLFRKDRA
jgi:hypothetical protein